jgi:hypothetical protein
LPLSAGATTSSAYEATLTKNLGSIANRGIEIGLNVDIIKQKNFKWSVGTEFTYFKNTILSLPEENRELGIISGTKKFMEGHGRYDFWAYQFAGTDQLTGRALYLLNDKDYYVQDPKVATDPDEKRTAVPAEYTVNINDVDYVYRTTYAKRDWSGSAIPDFMGSFNTAFSYKSLTLSALFTFAYGGKMYDYNYNDLLNSSGTPGALHVDTKNTWQGAPEGMTETSSNRIDKNQRPAFDFTRNTDHVATSTQYLLDASYLVFKNINLSYNLPRTWIHNLDLSGVRLNFTVENLFTLTSVKGMNPQQSFDGAGDVNALTPPRVISFGLNVQF